tara:strand:+ start:380 stop:910 length:531 start_codon:yes stop_codon:yes gene_type:complete
MALWGSNDNLTSAGTVWLDYSTGIVTATGTSFADADVGKVIRFGVRGGVYMGDAQIKVRTSATQVSIANTAGLSGVAIAGTDYYLSELPSYSVNDNSYSETNSGYDKVIYGISTTTSQTYDGDAGKYRTSGAGWVGVTTYVDMHGTLRVKSETLVAIGGATGITTGANGIAYPTAG